MNNFCKKFKYLTTIVVTILLTHNIYANKPNYLSPRNIAYDQANKKLVIIATTDKKLLILDEKSEKVTSTIKLPRNPSGIAISKDGKTYYVTGGGYWGTVWIIDSKTKKIKQTIKTNHTPLSPVLSADEKRLYICERFNNTVAIIDLKKYKKIATIPAVREPHSLIIDKKEKYIFAINLLSHSQANKAYNASFVTVIDIKKKKQVKNIKLSNGINTLREICQSPDEKYAYLTCVIGRYQVPTTQLERGWIYTNGITILNIDKQSVIATVLLDDVDLGASNPWGISCNKDGKILCVTHSGTHEISIIDCLGLHKKIDKTIADGKGDYIINGLSFLYGIRRRINLTGKGPRGITIVNNNAYVTEYFTDSICKVNLDPKVLRNTSAISLGPKVPMTQERLGELYFNDATLCFQKWQSCASCHPDTRSDSLNWDLLNDGIGNPKQSKSMLQTHITPPVMSLGVRARAEVAVRAGIRYILFATRPESEAKAIDAYLKSLTPLPSRYLINGEMSKSAKRGKKVFAKAGCIICHPAPLYTNLQSYDVGTGTGQDIGKKFDTPSLIEIWRSAPYIHDGRAINIRDVITKHNPLGKRGNTKALSKKELDDLIAFIMSL